MKVRGRSAIMGQQRTCDGSLADSIWSDEDHEASPRALAPSQSSGVEVFRPRRRAGQKGNSGNESLATPSSFMLAADADLTSGPVAAVGGFPCPIGFT